MYPPVPATYRTSDGSLYIRFLFWDLDGDDIVDKIGGWRIYIISSINFRGQKDDCASTHRIHDYGETYPYICWTSKIETFEQAEAVAALWGDCIALYIKGEGKFDDIARRLMT